MGNDYEDGDKICQPHWLSVKRALAGNAVISGLTTARTGVLTATVQPGVYYANGTRKTMVGVTNFLLSAGDLTYDRWDIITADTVGLNLRQGTPSVSPRPVPLLANEILIAAILVPSGALDIADAYIRPFYFTNNFLEHDHGGAGGASVGHNNLLSVLGANELSADTTKNKHVSDNQLKVLYDDKHTRLHNIENALDHSLSGATTGEVLRASGATTFDFRKLLWSDMGETSGFLFNVLPLSVIDNRAAFGSSPGFSTASSSFSQATDEAVLSVPFIKPNGGYVARVIIAFIVSTTGNNYYWSIYLNGVLQTSTLIQGSLLAANRVYYSIGNYAINPYNDRLYVVIRSLTPGTIKLVGAYIQIKCDPS